jgi:hypothetical protein
LAEVLAGGMERIVIAIAAGEDNDAKFHGEFLGRLSIILSGEQA